MSYTLTELRTAIQDYTENDETTFLNNLTNLDLIKFNNGRFLLPRITLRLAIANLG